MTLYSKQLQTIFGSHRSVYFKYTRSVMNYDFFCAFQQSCHISILRLTV